MHRRLVRAARLAVGLIARGEQGLAASRRDIEAAGGRAATAQAEVTDSAALARAADAIVTTLGPVDVWINCAGNGVYGRFDDVPEHEFQRVTDVTYHGAVNGTRVALAKMRARDAGTIVNVCSAIAFHGLPLMSSYAGAKAAVRAFGQAVQGELRLERSRIRISTVFPPAVKHAVLQSRRQPHGLARAAGVASLSAGGRRPGHLAGCRERQARDDDQRHGDGVLVRDPHDARPDRLVHGAVRHRKAADHATPTPVSLQEPTLFAAVAARVRHPWPVQTRRAARAACICGFERQMTTVQMALSAYVAAPGPAPALRRRPHAFHQNRIARLTVWRQPRRRFLR